MAKKVGMNLVTMQLVREALDEHWPGLSTFVHGFDMTGSVDGVLSLSLHLRGIDLLDTRCPLIDVDGDGSGGDRCALGVNHDGECHF